VSQLSGARLIDEHHLVVNPTVLGRGRTLFEGLERPMPLRLTDTRTFGNGNVVMRYEPAG
jgi:dihydrofolate reductase